MEIARPAQQLCCGRRQSGGLGSGGGQTGHAPRVPGQVRRLQIHEVGHGLEHAIQFVIRDRAGQARLGGDDGVPAGGVVKATDLVGWSDGATIALLVAWRRPDLVRKPVYIGQNVTVDGLRPAFKAMLGHLSVEHLPPMLAELYGAVSPDGPGHFADVFHRLSSSWTLDSPLPLSRLGEITAPTLVIAGDDDVLTLAHVGELQDGLTNAQVAILPGATHTAPMEQPDLVNQLILAFLAAPVPVRAT